MVCFSPTMAAKRASSAGSRPTAEFESIRTLAWVLLVQRSYTNAGSGETPQLARRDDEAEGSARGARQLLLPGKTRGKRVGSGGCLRVRACRFLPGTTDDL